MDFHDGCMCLVKFSHWCYEKPFYVPFSLHSGVSVIKTQDTCSLLVFCVASFCLFFLTILNHSVFRLLKN